MSPVDSYKKTGPNVSQLGLFQLHTWRCCSLSTGFRTGRQARKPPCLNRCRTVAELMGWRSSRIQRLLRRADESILFRLAIRNNNLSCLWDDFRGRPDLGRSFTELSSLYQRQTSFTVEMGIPSCADIAALVIRPFSFKLIIWYRSATLVRRISDPAMWC